MPSKAGLDMAIPTDSCYFAENVPVGCRGGTRWRDAIFGLRWIVPHAFLEHCMKNSMAR